MTGQPGRSGGKREGAGRPPGGSGGRSPGAKGGFDNVHPLCGRENSALCEYNNIARHHFLRLPLMALGSAKPILRDRHPGHPTVMPSRR